MLPDIITEHYYDQLRFDRHGSRTSGCIGLPAEDLPALPELGKLVTRDEQPFDAVLCDDTHPDDTTRGAVSRHGER
jgi:hypothetical protein